MLATLVVVLMHLHSCVERVAVDVGAQTLLAPHRRRRTCAYSHGRRRQHRECVVPVFVLVVRSELAPELWQQAHEKILQRSGSPRGRSTVDLDHE